VTVAIRQTLPKLEHKLKAIVSEFLEDGLLIPAGDKQVFAHLSFQEYLAAKDLVQATGKRASQALSMYLGGDDWWRGVICFYIELMSRPNETLAWIEDMAAKVMFKEGNVVVEPRVEYLRSVVVQSRSKGSSN
jgi:predicted NACHT family NTPase